MSCIYYSQAAAPNSYDTAFLYAAQMKTRKITGMKEKRMFPARFFLKKRTPFFLSFPCIFSRGNGSGMDGIWHFYGLTGFSRHDTVSSKRCLKPHIIFEGQLCGISTGNMQCNAVCIVSIKP